MIEKRLQDSLVTPSNDLVTQNIKILCQNNDLVTQNNFLIPVLEIGFHSEQSCCLQEIKIILLWIILSTMFRISDYTNLMACCVQHE